MAFPSYHSNCLYLLKNVPLSMSYEHTIDFKDRDEQISYFYSFLKYSFYDFTYVRKEREYIVAEVPIKDLEDVNYMYFRSQEDERFCFAFITDVVYVNPSTSQIYYSIDVLQTYQFEYEWQPTYIKQAHIDRWTADHKPIYSKTDEGLDYGTEYSVESAYKIQSSTVVKWLLVSCTDYSALEGEGHNATGGTINPAPTPFATLLVPVPMLVDSTNTPYDVFALSSAVEDGEQIQKAIATYSDLVKLFSNSAFGNTVKSVTLLPYTDFVHEVGVTHLNQILVSFTEGAKVATRYFKGVDLSFVVLLEVDNYKSALKEGRTLAITDWNTGLTDSLPTEDQWEEVKKYPFATKRDKRFESKLLCAPYRYNLLTDWRNAPVIFKNEYMTDDNIEVKYSYALSYNAPFRYWIKNYKKDPEGRYTCLNQPVGLDFPVLSDAYYTYMLENKNTIQANVTNAMISAGAGVISGAASGGILGAIGGLASGAVNVSAQMRSENAKQQDLKAVPDTVINSTDSTFYLLDDNTDITFYRMRICCENEEILANIFHATGYRVNRIDVPNTRSRTRFNYIQTVGANITGSFNQRDLQQIKEIYNRGITIWHYNTRDFKPFDYTYENIEVNLI